jgi:DNA uptake protein ComE-like DNA-binding protein
VILSAMLLVFAQQMRGEAILSGARVSQAKADAIEQGAEQWVLAQVEANVTPLSGTTSTSATSTQVDPTSIPAEAIQVGDGYFWLLHPDPTQDQTYGFGLVDESGKLNLNGATADQLDNLPNMTTDIGELIADWPSSTTEVGGTLTFETPESLLLVDPSLTPQMLYGFDLNHDGVIDPNEMAQSGGAAITNGTTSDSRGFFNYVTTFSTNAAVGTVGTTVGATTRVGGRVTVAQKTIGLINVNTAPAQVLACLPGMTTADATSMVSARGSLTSITPGDTSWVSQAVGPSVALQLAPYITGTSYQYSADIVAVSGDGKAFKRVRIVVDARSQPAVIVYRKDLTSLGWPLGAETQTSLRAGKGVPADMQGTTNAQGTGGL